MLTQVRIGEESEFILLWYRLLVSCVGTLGLELRGARKARVCKARESYCSTLTQIVRKCKLFIFNAVFGRLCLGTNGCVYIFVFQSKVLRPPFE